MHVCLSESGANCGKNGQLGDQCLKRRVIPGAYSVKRLRNGWSIPGSAASCAGSAAKPRPLVEATQAHALAGGNQLCHGSCCVQEES